MTFPLTNNCICLKQFWTNHLWIFSKEVRLVLFQSFSALQCFYCQWSHGFWWIILQLSLAVLILCFLSFFCWMLSISAKFQMTWWILWFFKLWKLWKLSKIPTAANQAMKYGRRTGGNVLLYHCTTIGDEEILS